MPVGIIGVTPGPVMASAEIWRATITGKGGHAAHPENAVDPIVTAALMVTALQTVVSRNVGAQQTAVITTGLLRSGDTFNVIPDTAELSGTIRTFNPQVRETVLRRFEEVLIGTTQMMGAKIAFELDALTPAVVNDAKITKLVQQVVTDSMGTEALNVEMRTMGSEDAAFFLQEVPGCYFFVGSRPEENPATHHNPHFDIDERAMLKGTAVMVASLQRLMPGSEVA